MLNWQKREKFTGIGFDGFHQNLVSPGVHVAGTPLLDGSVYDERVVDVDEEGELGAGRERRDVGALQLHRQLLIRLSMECSNQ